MMQKDITSFNNNQEGSKISNLNKESKKNEKTEQKKSNESSENQKTPEKDKNMIPPYYSKKMYSHSKLNTFEQCRLKFKFSYIDKLEKEIENTVEAFMGSRVHETLEKLYKDLKFEKLNTLQELLDYYNKEWNKNWNENILIVRDYPAENFRKVGERCITDYYNKYKPFNQDKTIAIEKRIVLKIGNHYLQGYIDRLSYEGNGVYVVNDYKTANNLMTQEYADKDRQLALYSMAVKEEYSDCKKVKLVWHYLAFDKKIESSRTEDELEKLRNDIINLIKDVEKCTDYPAKSSALCDWCEYKPYCPNYKHKYYLEKKEVNEYLNDDGVKLVNKYSELSEKKNKVEEELEKVKEALIKFAKEKGFEAVQGSDVTAIVKSYPKMSFPKKDDPRKDNFIETVKNLGLWDAVATVDVYELTKMINRKEIHPELISVLENFIDKGTNDRIYLRWNQ